MTDPLQGTGTINKRSGLYAVNVTTTYYNLLGAYSCSKRTSVPIILLKPETEKVHFIDRSAFPSFRNVLLIVGYLKFGLSRSAFLLMSSFLVTANSSFMDICSHAHT